MRQQGLIGRPPLAQDRLEELPDGFLCQLIVGATQVPVARRLRSELPATNEHCALLAANTLHAAIEDDLRTRGADWKRLYRSG